MNLYGNVNLARPATATDPISDQIANVGLRVPYIVYQATGLQRTYSDARSSYHGFQATVRHSS